jgi:hypothetical protein
VGRRIGSKELIQTKQLENEEAKELHHFHIEGALRQTATNATIEGLAHPMMKDAFLQSFMAIIQAYAPFEAVQAMMRELEKSAYNVNTFQQRFPDYAEVIGMAWHRAIQQACEILSTPASSASASAI